MLGWGKMRDLFMSDDEGLGKKDDDHKAVKSPRRRQPTWQPARVPPRRTLKRIGLLALVAIAIYVFIQNIPVLGPNDRMRRPTYPASGALRRPPPSPDHVMHPPDPVAQPGTKAGVPIPAAKPIERNFDGPIRYEELGASLQAVLNTGGSQQNNVIFAAASFRSAATLLPMACQMGSNLQNHVHFALLGGSSISMEQLREINGVDKTCAVIFHDARPNFAAISTDRRLEKSVYRAFYHINNYVHPQAIFIDGSNDEEAYLTRGVLRHVKLSKTTVIELPGSAGKTLDWIAKVDSAALRMWDKVQIDILIQVAPGSSGSLIRLLRSLAAADYTGSVVPHITIELPSHIERSTKTFLDLFAWPPAHMHGHTNARALSLRHRMPHQGLTEDESLVRFFESFWPAQPQQSHVLVLSPHVQVGPRFFQYLKYILLEYRYSTAAQAHSWDRRLFGFSLEQPSTTLEGKPFSPPLFHHPDHVHGEKGSPNPFLWQAPASNAMLILGDKWMELHDFVSRTMQAIGKLHATPTIVSEKRVSRQHPAWLEHALRLARVRGYWFVYPGDEVAGHLATVHGELYTVPEEFAAGAKQQRKRKSTSNDADDDNNDDEDDFTAESLKIRDKVRSRSSREVQVETSLSLLESFPNNGKLWPLSALPIAAWDGAEVRFEAFRSAAYDFEAAFKIAVGGCDVDVDVDAEGNRQSKGKGQKPFEPMLTQDLFCNVL
ncbi:hypothetical protein F5Y17DRAFT_330238 [Xylariaceae sp. FL0594]|nr:hypothetical protein F5Y17DRAFT_330238 [Xylariaceae sp. FL0594]